MRNLSPPMAILVTVVMLLLTGCVMITPETADAPSAATIPDANAEPERAPRVVDPMHPPADSDTEEFDPSNFGEDSANLTNEWMPWQPGMHWVFEGESIEGDERTAHRIEYTVTDLTKMIDGVRTALYG
ncbi:MAG: hypothetical protein R2867_14215 [Caldilineaceae bacterium]